MNQSATKAAELVGLVENLRILSQARLDRARLTADAVEEEIAAREVSSFERQLEQLLTIASGRPS